MAKLQRLEPKPVTGYLKTWEELLERNELPAELQAEDLFQDLHPEEETIIEEILNSPAIQVRLRALLFTLILNNVGGKLRWIPFKGKILSMIWKELNEQFNSLLDRAEEWYQNRKS